MRLGIDARLPYFRTGGISEYVVNLLEALAEPGVLGPSDRVLVLQARGDQIRRAPDDARFTRADVDTPCHHPRERILLASELRALRLEVLHSPDVIPPAFGADRRVVSVFDLGFLDHPTHVTPDSRDHYGGQIAWAMSSADAVITASLHVRRQLIDRFGCEESKVIAIPLAAAPRFLSDLDRDRVARILAAHGLEPGYLLWVGTLEPRKNLPMLLRAYAQLRASGRANVPLVLAGPRGWMMGDLEDRIRHTDGVRWLDGVPAEELPALYASASVLALPSILEGFGLPMIEAMQSGCPVVASTGGALSEVAGDAALLVDPDDEPGWIAALERLLTDRALVSQLQARGSARAAALSWRRTAEQTVTVYREAAVSRQAREPNSVPGESSDDA